MSVDELTALLSALARQSVALASVSLVLLSIRSWVRRRFGAALMASSWLLVPILMLATSAPVSARAHQLALGLMQTVDGPYGLTNVTEVWSPGEEVARVCVAIWLMGALFVAVSAVAAHRRYVRRLSTTPGQTQWTAPAGSSPALLGLLHPRLVLPADFETRFGPVERMLVLAHEHAHRERRDNLWNCVALTICALHWFNPLAWLAMRGMREDQELACDAEVMRRHPAHELHYGRALLLAQSSAVSPLATLPWTNWTATHPLTKRIAMLKQPHTSTNARRAGVALITAIGVAGVAAVFAWRAAAAATVTDTTATIELAMELGVTTADAGAFKRKVSMMTMRVYPGERAQLILDGSPDKPSAGQLVIGVRTDEPKDDKWQLDVTILRGHPGTSIASPRLIVADGSTGRIEINESPGQTLALSITPRKVTGEPGH